MNSLVIFIGTALAAGGGWVYKEAFKETLTGIVEKLPIDTDYIRGRYRGYKAFKGFLEETHSNTFSVHYTMLNLLFTARYRKLEKSIADMRRKLAHIQSTAKPLGEESIQVEYYHDGKVYKLKIATPKRFEQVLKVADENDTNVTKTVAEYLGPAHDFHGAVYTPKELGYKCLEFSNGLDKLVFSAEEPIILKFPSLG